MFPLDKVRVPQGSADDVELSTAKEQSADVAIELVSPPSMMYRLPIHPVWDEL